MGIFVFSGQQVFRQQPDTINWLQQSKSLPLCVLADDVAPSVNHPLRQMPISQLLISIW
jgi:hypothetical protein